MKGFLSHYASVVKRFGAIIAAAVFALAVGSPAHASPPEVDFAALVNGAKAELVDAMIVVGPLVFGILGIIAAIGFAWRYFKRAAKSS